MASKQTERNRPWKWKRINNKRTATWNVLTLYRPGGTVYTRKHVLTNGNLKSGKRDQETELTGGSPLRSWVGPHWNIVSYRNNMKKKNKKKKEEQQQDQANSLNLLPKYLKKNTVLYVLEYEFWKLRMVGYNHRQSIITILCPKLYSLPCLISCM